LTLQILLAAGLFEVLVAEEVSDGFFGGANGLVPLAVGAVFVVLGHGAG
jgi:cadmium resistance protein CadD (predicted permease)